jgi:hypothetical protein
VNWSVFLQAEAARVSTTDPVSQLIVAAILVGVFTLLTIEAAHRVVVVLAQSPCCDVTYSRRSISLVRGTASAPDLNVLGSWRG